VPSIARSTTIVALLILIGALIATPTVASAATAVVTPATPVVTPQTTRSGDEIHVPGVTATFARSGSSVKRTNSVGGGSSVEMVYVSVAGVTGSTSDDVNFGMSESGIQTLISQLNSYWSAQSGGAVNVELAGYETRSLGASSCSPNSVLSAEEGKAFGGQFANNSWIGTNQHLLVLTKEACGHQSFATVGGSGGEIFSGNGISTALGMPYLLHEFGHNLGFEHADASICKNTGSLDSSIANFSFSSNTCPTTEYDDYLDIMGYTVKGATPNLSSPQRIVAGWLTDYSTATASAGSRSFTLSPLDGATGTRALKVTDPISGEVYYLEYRTPQGRDRTSAEFRYSNQCGASHGGYQICNLGSSTSTGVVRILRQLPFPAESASGTTVLAVGGLSGSSVKRNTRMKTGQTFVNFDRGFSVRLNSLSEAGGASVTVSFDLPATTATTVVLDKPTQTYSTSSPATAQVTVQSSKSEVIPSGTVAFYDGTTKLSTVAVDSTGGAAYALPSALAVGRHSITARFTPGSSDLVGSTSHATTVTVSKIPSHVSLSLRSATVSTGHHESVTVTVSANGVPAPTGTLTAYVNGRSVGNHILTASRAGTLTFSLPVFTTKGTKKISISYHGTSHIAASTSATSSMRAV
jgi:hypothetical protein